MVNLPSEATVLDFAYAIHTDLGNHCIGANVNHRLVPGDYQVKSGDQVEVITSRIQQPNEDWFKYVVTARAKSQIKQDNSKPNINKLLVANKIKSPVDLYYYVATEKIGFKEVRDALQPQESIVNWMRNIRFPFVRPKSPAVETSAEQTEVQETVSPVDVQEIGYRSHSMCGIHISVSVD